MEEPETESRAVTTLFLLVSVDGKISSGESATLDVESDWNRIHGVKEGLSQYYEIERTTDPYSLICAKVLVKLGANAKEVPEERPRRSEFLHLIVIDRKPWLTEHGIRFVAQGTKRLYLITNNRSHPAHALRTQIDNLDVISYPDEIDFSDLFRKMKQDHGGDHITVQAGGTLNAVLVRAGLVDHLLIVVAPLLVGGKVTPTLIDGRSLRGEAELPDLKALKLTKCEALADSYVRLEYDVIQDTVIDVK